MRKILFLIFCFVFLMSGCGSPGGGAEFFETVMVTAHSNISGFDSDIITWRQKDQNKDPNSDLEDPNSDLCDKEYLVKADTVKITIRSELFPVIELEEASPVRIESVRIEYHILPGGWAPTLDSKNLPLGQVVEPNTTGDLEVRVMSQEQKLDLLSNPIESPLCTNDIYQYSVSLSFSAEEVTTGTRGVIKTDLTLYIADFEGDDDDCVPDLSSFCL